MIGDARVDIYLRSLARDGEGNMVPSFAYYKTITARGGVMPAGLGKIIKPDESKPYGWSQEPMKFQIFFDPDQNIGDLDRVKYNSQWYEIRGIDIWPTYSAAQLVLVQGGM